MTAASWKKYDSKVKMNNEKKTGVKKKGCGCGKKKSKNT